MEIGLARLSCVHLAVDAKVLILNRYFAPLKAFRDVARLVRRVPTGLTEVPQKLTIHHACLSQLAFSLRFRLSFLFAEPSES